MANPTTNFGWVMPTSTSLVTNLPADFNTFGQGVDTSMAQLKGGTTGQILSKTSATDMAFTWITPNPGDITGVTAGTGISGGGTSGDVTITNSMATAMTTKGDLVPATGSGTFSRLAIGTNGQVLTADSTAATGMKWNTSLASPLTTKGDIWTYSTTDARLAVGTNGQTLVADSTTSTGLKWATASAGAVLQVKNAIKTNYQSISATSNTDITDLSVAITPSSSSNKVLVLVSINGVSAGGGTSRARLLLTDGSGTQLAALNDYAVLGTPMSSYSISYLDSPATTSSKTYKIMGNVVDASSSFLVNNYQSITIRSTITVMEVTP